MRPIPYYVMALVMLIMFAYVIPIFPFGGAYPLGTHVEFTPQFMLTGDQAFGAAGAQPGDRRHGRLVPRHEVAHLEHHLRGLRGLRRDRRAAARTRSFSATSCATRCCRRSPGWRLQLGLIFNGALIMEVVFGYPGMGTLTLQAVMANDYTLIMGIAIFSIIGVATSVLILDLIYPLFDPRVRHQ